MRTALSNLAAEGEPLRALLEVCLTNTTRTWGWQGREIYLSKGGYHTGLGRGTVCGRWRLNTRSCFTTNPDGAFLGRLAWA